MALFRIKTVEDRERVRKIEHETLKVWESSFNQTMRYLGDHNRFLMECQHKNFAGAHAPEGVVEARLPLHLMILAMKGDMNILNDDEKWYKFLKKHEQFRTYDYNRKVRI